MKNCYFDIAVAEAVGVYPAILFNHIAYLVETNRAEKRNFAGGKYWVTKSVSGIMKLFPFLSRKVIRTALDRLLTAGLIEIVQLTAGGSASYTLTEKGWMCYVDKADDTLAAEGKPLAPEGKPLAAEGKPLAPEGKVLKEKERKEPKERIKKDNYNSNYKNNIALQDALSASAGADAGHKLSYEKEFELIWAKYPTCRKQGKKRALAAFIRARRGGTSWAEIDDGLTAYKNYIARRGIRDEFIQQGGTWFTGEGWRDEYGGGKNDNNSGRGSGVGSENDRTFVPSTGFRKGDEQIPNIGAGEGA